MLEQILWLLSWPVFIIISYRLVVLAIKKLEKKIALEEKVTE
ncbi:MAG: hypothetical protein U5Q03_07375 [Bacteroidota bacterium]|nr:hypothetical protein [Bacteroidota bacterium]